MIALIVLLVVCGVILYLVESYIPMAPPFKMIIRVVVILVLCLYLLRAFGIVDMPIPQVR